VGGGMGDREVSMTHTVRTRDGATVALDGYTRSKAIKAMCSECMGWEAHPKRDCTSPLCPLYPYRGRTLATQTATPRARVRKGTPGRQNGRGGARVAGQGANGRTGAR